MLNGYQQGFFDKTVKSKKFRKCITSKNEYEFKEILDSIGLKEEEDYFHQACFTDDEMVIVADFSLPKWKVVIEIDGKYHRCKTAKELDKKKDAVFKYNNYKVFRFNDDMTMERKCFLKVYLKNILEMIDEDIPNEY